MLRKLEESEELRELHKPENLGNWIEESGESEEPEESEKPGESREPDEQWELEELGVPEKRGKL